jgi:hypothetical protein
MAKLQYGKSGHYLVFANDAEFFLTYGFLCNSQKHALAFQWEYNANSGAWGNEGRIHFLSVGGNDYSPKPQVINKKLTAGYGNIVHRVNCNEYIKELVLNYGFSVNPQKPGNKVSRSPQGLLPPANPQIYVPNAYLNDFMNGFNM